MSSITIIKFITNQIQSLKSLRNISANSSLTFSFGADCSMTAFDGLLETNC